MRFSVITICYNSEKTIERTIQSVLTQTYTDYEYIIVDGGSKDGTLDIVKKYEPLFEGRMKWKSEPDHGIYDAMNKGIARSTGEVIGIVNSDDWLEPDALRIVERCYAENDQTFSSVCCGWMNFHYSDGTIQVLKTDENQLARKAQTCEMGGVRHPATFVPKKVYNEQGTFDTQLKILADTDLIVRLYKAGVNFIFPNKVLTNMSDGGVSNKSLMRACKDYSVILRKNGVRGLKYIKMYYPWRIKRFLKGYMPTSLLAYYRNKSKV